MPLNRAARSGFISRPVGHRLVFPINKMRALTKINKRKLKISFYTHSVLTTLRVTNDLTLHFCFGKSEVSSTLIYKQENELGGAHPCPEYSQQYSGILPTENYSLSKRYFSCLIF